MQTDEFFYEFFRFDPRLLFRLVRLELEGDYTFESITVKRVRKKKGEKRLDGLLSRRDGQGVYVFAEFQGYRDPKIYWRQFREIATWYEQLKGEELPFVAIVLFLDPAHDPGPPIESFSSPHRLVRANLMDCLKVLRGPAGPLAALKPLVVESREELARQVPEWRREIEGLNLPAHECKFLMECLGYAILERFPTLTTKELQTMLRWLPLKETVAGREVFDEGLEQGIEKGELIGQIRTLQRMLRHPVASREELTAKSLHELSAVVAELETHLQ